MDKQSKFKLLQEIALTYDEAEEYFDSRASPQDEQNHIFLPLTVVYVSPRQRLRTLPYLDLTQKDKVWGVTVHGILVHKENITAPFRVLRKKLEQENAGCDKYSCFRRFPKVCEWEYLFEVYEVFNQVMQTFRRYEIAADDLQIKFFHLCTQDVLVSFLTEEQSLAFASDNDEMLCSRFVVSL
ncbi:MAG: hypothetical protein Q4D80_03545 [Pseudomonadota bacterium]|nr:hypothetical protein [Pseudomonadota bacterium]